MHHVQYILIFVTVLYVSNENVDHFLEFRMSAVRENIRAICDRFVVLSKISF